MQPVNPQFALIVGGSSGIGLATAQLLVKHTDETVKVCTYNFSESAFLQAKLAIFKLTLRTI